MPQPLQLALAERVKQLRDRLSLTQAEIAAQIGVSHNTYFRAEAYGQVGLKARRKIEAYLKKEEKKLARA